MGVLGGVRGSTAMGVRERSRYVFDENDEPLSSSKMSEKSRTTQRKCGKNCANSAPVSGSDLRYRGNRS